MSEEEKGNKPGLARMLGAAVVTLGFLLLITRLPPPSAPTESKDTDVSLLPRQRVVIFLVDTTDYFDAHGAYVHSVIRQYCPSCEVRQVNLRGDLSTPTIIQALYHIREEVHEHEATSTILVNLSLGTYAYDEGLHTAVRTLDAEGIILLASAGNDNTSKPFYPAAFQEVVGICSSTRHTKAKAAYSNFGPWISLCAPGLHYVTRPLQQGTLASGTSFASPMATGVLGQILLHTPCAPPRAGLRALQRTAESVAEGTFRRGVGVLNPAAASHYLRSLYACQNAGWSLQRLVTSVKRLAAKVGLSLGLIVYFFLSIFTIPFLLALSIEKIQRRAAYRQQQAMHNAYTGSCAYRRQRLLAMHDAFVRQQKVRRRDQPELFALLHARYMYGEPCWWCSKPTTEYATSDVYAGEATVCSRCGLGPIQLSPSSPKMSNNIRQSRGA